MYERKGYFVISLDVELAWGFITHPALSQFLPLIEQSRSIVSRLLELFEAYDIPVTWAVVGRLLADPAAKPLPLSVYYREVSIESLFADHRLHTASNSLLCGNDLIEKILHSSVRHEIACHSYDHILFGDPECSCAMAEEDIQRSGETASAWGLRYSSFVFPKNQVCFLEVLTKYGFRVYRGKNRVKHARFSGWLRRLIYGGNMLVAFDPPVMVPFCDEHGLINIPASMLFRLPYFDWKKYFPGMLLTKYAVAGLFSSVKKKKLFHIWFHPFDFGWNPHKNFEALEYILKVAVTLRESGSLEILTMKAVAETYV